MLDRAPSKTTRSVCPRAGRLRPTQIVPACHPGQADAARPPIFLPITIFLSSHSDLLSSPLPFLEASVFSRVFAAIELQFRLRSIDGSIDDFWKYAQTFREHTGPRRKRLLAYVNKYFIYDMVYLQLEASSCI